jgi:hypothetical protein
MANGPSWPSRLEEQRSFNRWLTANAALSSIFIAGFIAMAVVGGSGTKEDIQVSAAAKANVQHQSIQLPAELLTPVLDKRSSAAESLRTHYHFLGAAMNRTASQYDYSVITSDQSLTRGPICLDFCGIPTQSGSGIGPPRSRKSIARTAESFGSEV